MSGKRVRMPSTGPPLDGVDMHQRTNGRGFSRPSKNLEDIFAAISELQHPRASLEDLTELSSRLLLVQDQERRRIARDLHDSLGQIIAMAKINLDRIAKMAKLDPEPADLLSQTAALVERMATEVRTVSHLLHPPLLDELGLAAAVQELVAGFTQRCGIEVSLRINDTFNRLPSDVEISIYRIVQESLTNIHRHSASQTARVLMEQLDGEIRIQVQDDGKGMPEEAARSGVGLRGMRERTMQLHGTLEVQSSRRGTTVIARLPLSEKSSSGESVAGSRS